MQVSALLERHAISSLRSPVAALIVRSSVLCEYALSLISLLADIWVSGQPENRTMTTAPQRTYRAAALEGAVSPEQLDDLVVVSRPADWIIVLVVLVAAAAALAWGIFGRVPSRFRARES